MVDLYYLPNKNTQHLKLRGKSGERFGSFRNRSGRRFGALRKSVVAGIVSGEVIAHIYLVEFPMCCEVFK